MVGPLLDFDRQATRFHVAGHKLQLLAHYYWVTRDKEYITGRGPSGSRWSTFIRESRKTDNGLLPKDRYAGDIDEQVYSLNSNAACWRGLRDMAAVLDDMGERDRRRRALREGSRVPQGDPRRGGEERAARHEAPFIPIALLGDEEPHDPLTATRTGQLLRPDDPLRPRVRRVRPGRRARGLDHRLPAQPRRARDGDDPQHAAPGEFDKQPGVNVLYGLRYKLDARCAAATATTRWSGSTATSPRAMTRDTFIGGEGSRFFHGDEHGRSFYLPPEQRQQRDVPDDARATCWSRTGTSTTTASRRRCGCWTRSRRGGCGTGRCSARNGRRPTFGAVSFRVESRLEHWHGHADNRRSAAAAQGLARPPAAATQL